MTQDDNPLSNWPHVDQPRAEARGPSGGAGAPQPAAPISEANALERFLGDSPGAVALKLLLISLVVGALMMWLEIRPADIFRGVLNFIDRIYALGFGAVRELLDYVLAGAVIVVPVWFLMRVFNAGGKKP